MLETATNAQRSYSSRLGTRENKGWTELVEEQINKGGGALFKFISKLDKQFLNVNWVLSKGGNNSPTYFIKSQAKKWSSCFVCAFA